MPYYIPKPDSYGRVHSDYGTLSADMKPVFTNWSGPQIDWIECAAPVESVPVIVVKIESETASDTFQKHSKKNKPADSADKE